MKKTYSMPSVQVIEAQTTKAVLQRASWAVDGDNKPVIEGNPDEIGAKENKFSAWSTWNEEDDEQ